MEFTTGLLALGSVFGSLSGLWQQPCSQGLLRTETIAVSSGKGTSRLDEGFFSDVACTSPSYVFTSEGKVEFHEELLPQPEWPADARAVDFTFEKVSITFKRDSLVTWANTTRLCDLTGWKKDVAMEVTGRYCKFFGPSSTTHVPEAGEARYGIYHLTEMDGAPALQWGNLTRQFNGTSPETRPRSWDTVQIYRHAR